MTDLAYTIEPAVGLDIGTVDAMFALYGRYYDAATADRFRHDLTEKDFVILLRDGDGALQGFSTALVGDHRFEGRRLRSFYSGDTIVDEAYWGQQALPTAWFQLTGHIKAAEPETPLYWFLLVKGHRTYRYLYAFFKDFSPHHKRATAPFDRTLTDMLAAERFGDAYDPCQGVIRFPESHGHLKAAWAEIPAKDRRRPEVRFFLERNPGYVNGDELVCLTELKLENLKPLAARLFRKGMDNGV
jgi:hypothetical protein